MSEQRKFLLAILALLLFANIAALMMANDPPTEALWIGSPAIELMPSQEGAEGVHSSAPLVTLDHEGAKVAGMQTAFTSMISNVGSSAFIRNQLECRKVFHGCADSPWTARALIDREAPVSVVIAAYEAVAAVCKVEIIFFTEFTHENGEVTTWGFPVMFAESGHPALTDFSSEHSWNSTLPVRRAGETLHQFGERTGCGQISPLRA